MNTKPTILGKLLDSKNFPLKIPDNEEVVVGPDDKAVLFSNGEPVFVPRGQYRYSS